MSRPTAPVRAAHAVRFSARGVAPNSQPLRRRPRRGVPCLDAFAMDRWWLDLGDKQEVA